MSLEYIALSIPVPDSIDQCIAIVESALAQRGEPIRWAITRIDAGTCAIEAVVSVPSEGNDSRTGNSGTMLEHLVE